MGLCWGYGGPNDDIIKGDKSLAIRYILRQLQYIFVRKKEMGNRMDAEYEAILINEVKEFAKHHDIPMANSAVGDALLLIEEDWTPSSMDCGYHTSLDEY